MNARTTPMVIIDMAESPDFNLVSNSGRGDWSLYDVSNGEVFVDSATNTPRCIIHGAMNSVSETRTIWQCLTCSRSCFRVFDTV